MAQPPPAPWRSTTTPRTRTPRRPSSASSATDAVGVTSYRVANGSDCSAPPGSPSPRRPVRPDHPAYPAGRRGSEDGLRPVQGCDGERLGDRDRHDRARHGRARDPEHRRAERESGGERLVRLRGRNRFTASDVGGSGLDSSCASSFPRGRLDRLERRYGNHGRVRRVLGPRRQHESGDQQARPSRSTSPTRLRFSPLPAGCPARTAGTSRT